MRAALVTVGVLLALPAHATWRFSQISGTPRDVDTLDAGVGVVASSDPGGMMAIFAGRSDAGFAQQISAAGNFVSAEWRPPACLIGLQGDGIVFFAGSCPTGLNSLGGGAAVSGRIRRQPSGALYVYGGLNTGGAIRVQWTGPTTGSMQTDWLVLTPGLTNYYAPDAPLSVLTIGGAEFSSWGFTNISAVDQLNVFRDAGSVRNFNPLPVRDVALFERNGGPAAFVVTDAGKVLLNPDVGASVFAPVNAPLRPYTSVTFSASGGSPNGVGFGMLTVGDQIYSPVPNPNALGRDWVLRTEDAGFKGPLVRATCFDPSYCMAITSSTATQNVFAYFNDFSPTSDLRAALVTEGSTSTYALDAGDGDGDPLWVTWIDGGFYWDGGDPRTITVIGPPPTGLCGAGAPTAPPLIAVLSDGLAAHDRQIAIPVAVISFATMLPALIANPASLTFTAGGASQSVNVGYPPDSGCPLPSMLWSISPDGGLFGLAAGLGSVAVTPPAAFCRATQLFNLRGSGAADASVNVPVTVNGWGEPYAPAFPQLSVTQRAGTDASYSADTSSVHPCDQWGAFPGTDLVSWIIDGGAPGVTVVTSPSKLTVYSTNACVNGTVFATVKQEVRGLSSQVSSGTGSLQVQLIADWSPITSATPFDAGFSYNAALSLLSGTFGIGANCLTDRDLHADVVVTTNTGAPVNASPSLAVPGPWKLDVTGGCAGGSYLASASLITDAGVRYGPIASWAFDAGRIAARVPSLKELEVPVTCAQGARGELELDLLPTDCAVQQFTWQQDQGPALVVTPDGGAKVSFATATQDLQAQAGQPLGFSITATIGVGNTAVASRSVRLVPAPFVQITHRTDVPIAREEEAVGVEVILTNPTACAVNPVVLRESLGGLTLIPGSVRVAGIKREEAVFEGGLEVQGLMLPALGTTRVTYLAKVPLLSAARPSAQVMLNGTDVTLTVARGPAAGCGCDASGGSAFALLALGAALVRSRRRSG